MVDDYDNEQETINLCYLLTIIRKWK